MEFRRNERRLDVDRRSESGAVGLGRPVASRAALARALATALGAALALACGDDAGSGGSESPPDAASEAPAPAPSSDAIRTTGPLPPAGEWQLAFANGVVSVDAFEAPRRPLLEALAQRAGFVLEAAPGPWPPLTLRVDALSLESVLPLLVGDLEYRAEWSSEGGAHRLAKLIVGGPRTEAAGAALRPGEVGDALQRALKALHDETDPMSEEEALRRIEDADAETRMRAVLALEGEGEGLAALVRVIERDPDPRVRAAATVGLEESEEFAAVQALVDALDDPHPEVVVEAIDSLEFAGDASVVPSLEPLLAHPDARGRKAAADAIGLLAD